MTDRAGVRTLTMAALVVIAAALLYSWRLADAPVHVTPDEAIIATDAHRLATTGRDATGTFLPLYFFIQVAGDTRSGWFTPAIFYLSAAVFQVLPFDETSARLATVLVGILSIGLVFALARRLFLSDTVALATALVLALAPGHFILSRYALDYLFPVPFIAGWLLCLYVAIEKRSIGFAAAAGVCLGLGFYSYIASMVMMPLYVALSCVVLWQQRLPARWTAALVGGAVVPLMPFVVWLLQHPDAFTATVQRYELYDTQRQTLLQGVRDFVGFGNVERMAALYWSFFNPSFLFLSGDSQMPFSTRSAGVFGMTAAVLIPAGIAQILGRERAPFTMLLLAGFLTAPAAAVLVPEPTALNRSVALLPFGALLAGFGVKRIVAARPVDLGGLRLRYGPALAAALVVALGWQFTSFARDYFGDYRIRSSPWLGGNLGGALETIIELSERSDVPRVYFAPIVSAGGLSDIRNRWIPAYWDFYTIKHARQDLLRRTERTTVWPMANVPSGSLALTAVEDHATTELLASGQFDEVARVAELGGDATLRIVRKR
jgi:4-amino-4-deoxy-L-arabinose transferase-like glycosyltransferase